MSEKEGKGRDRKSWVVEREGWRQIGMLEAVREGWRPRARAGWLDS